MIIIHKIDDFLFNLFPKAKEAGKSSNILKEELAGYYAFGPYKPKVEIDEEFVKIEIDTSAILSQKPAFDTAIEYCESGNFKKAKPVLEKLVKNNPTVSEYHRILGQIYSDEGNQEEAVNCLIDALRWDPKNSHALTMMGNIFAKSKKDIETAMTYYEQALKVMPDDHIAMNNIGANLMQLGKVTEAERYFDKAYSINSNYPNTIYAIGFYDEYRKYQKNDMALEAHQLVQKWAKELKVENYFTLVEENEYRNNPLNDTAFPAESDFKSKTSFSRSFGIGNHLNSPLEKGDRGLLKIDAGEILDEAGVTDAGNQSIPTLEKGGKGGFSNVQNEPAAQMAVTMYCLSALQYFADKDLEEIKKVGFEIAMLGRQGIDPAKTEKKYNLESIPGKEFTGLQLLAYMYSAFQVIDPFLETGLKFKMEYEAARGMYEKKGGEIRYAYTAIQREKYNLESSSISSLSHA